MAKKKNPLFTPTVKKKAEPQPSAPDMTAVFDAQRAMNNMVAGLFDTGDPFTRIVGIMQSVKTRDQKQYAQLVDRLSDLCDEEIDADTSQAVQAELGENPFGPTPKIVPPKNTTRFEMPTDEPEDDGSALIDHGSIDDIDLDIDDQFGEKECG